MAVGAETQEVRFGPVYPEEVAAVAKVRTELLESELSPIEWAFQKRGHGVGHVVLAEFSPTLRCSENCPGCPDATDSVAKRVAANIIPKVESRASTEDMLAKVDQLAALGVEHIMNIGGTIDHMPELPILIDRQVQRGMFVSWFSDGIPHIDESGDTKKLFERGMEAGWLRNVATHVSTDYIFGHNGISQGELLGEIEALPTQKGRSHDFSKNPEYSREFKSQYGAVFARRLIEAGAKRVVLNMTISHANHDQIAALYQQAVELQNYAADKRSPTEVLFTFSPWVWRPHQARGDAVEEHKPEDGLRPEDMAAVNEALSAILEDTYRRIDDGEPRILANSSGYTNLHAESTFNEIAVSQDVGYNNGRPIIYSVNPAAELDLDPMFKGPELDFVRHTFGYVDRTFIPDQNPFSKFHHGNRQYLPNIIALESREDTRAQPQRVMDYRLAALIVRSNVVYFGENLMNKRDSRSAMLNPRFAVTLPDDIDYITERLSYLTEQECSGDTVVGLSSLGLGLGMLIAKTARRKFLYAKTVAEPWKGKRFLEGDVSKVEDTRELTLVDDLKFAGNTKKQAIEIVQRHDGNGVFYPTPGMITEYGLIPEEVQDVDLVVFPEQGELDVAQALRITDSVTIIDRELAKKEDGPTLKETGVREHTLMTMSDLIHYMGLVGAITAEQLERLIADYRGYERHEMPAFAHRTI